MSNALQLQAPFKEYLVKLQDSDAIQNVVAEHITPERITGLMLDAASHAPLLYECVTTDPGRHSIAKFFMLCSATGLEPGSGLGLIYPIPKRLKVKSGPMKGQKPVQILGIIGYKGYCKLAMQSGEIKRINALPFYQDDLDKGTIRITKEPPDVDHRYDPTVREQDDLLVGAYAVAENMDGGKYVLVMSRDQIIARAKRGGGYGSDYSSWGSDFAAMCRKTVLRALLTGGTVPLSTEARQALAEDEGPESQSEHPAGDVTQLDPTPGSEPQGSGAANLRDALGMNGGGQVIDAQYEEASGPTSPFSGGYQ